MKGIAGIAYQDIFQITDLVKPSLKAMEHRGKTKDFYTFKNIQLGAAGGLIFFNKKRTLACILDGCLDNNFELKEILIKKGHSFISERDEEIVLQGYEAWGTSVFEHLSGCFAVVIIDQEAERLLIARDRIGKCSLYWFQDPHYFMFASELKALLATGAVPQAPAPEALSAYLYLGYIPQDMSPIKNVYKLLPGHYLQFNKDKSLRIKSYWSYSSYFEQKKQSSEQHQPDEIENLIKQSVKRHIPKEGNLGCFLCGGLGSGTIAYYMQREAPEKVHIYSADVNEADCKATEEIAKALSIPCDIAAITPDNFLEDLVQIAWHLDEPLADPQVIATWKMAELAARETKTVYSGMGSDEIFAGHCRYTAEEQPIPLQHPLLQKCFSSANHVLISFLNKFYPPAAISLLKNTRPMPWHFDYLSQNAIFDQKAITFAAPKLAGLFDPEVFLHKFYHLSKVKTTLSSLLYFDIKTRLPDLYILQFDRLTAAHQLDWYTPFLDKQIIEYLAAISRQETLKKQDTANILKELLKGVYPKWLIDRPKKARKNIMQNWIENSDLRKIFQLLAKGTLVESGIISDKWIKEVVKTAQRRRNCFAHLWSILALEIWFRLFINHPIETSPPNIGVIELLNKEF